MVVLEYTFVLAFIISEFHFITCDEFEEKDDKLLLELNELINRALLEKHKNLILLNRNDRSMNVKVTHTTLGFSTEETASTDMEDKECLKSRKIWSRWGKWGQCSVTCGEGIILRTRSCVSGRCAPGEFEEQRRPCNRAPCNPSVEPTDDLREQD